MTIPKAYKYTREEACSVPEHLITWINTHINKPIKGFDHKKNADGTLLSHEQQMHATRDQVLSVANYFFTRGRSQEEIIAIITNFSE
jgi:hypothetical protein